MAASEAAEPSSDWFNRANEKNETAAMAATMIARPAARIKVLDSYLIFSLSVAPSGSNAGGQVH